MTLPMLSVAVQMSTAGQLTASIALVPSISVADDQWPSADPALHSLVRSKSQRMPVNAAVVVPFAPLGNLAAHEQQLLARLGEHVAEQQTQIGIFLPVVSRHFAEQRTLAVHHFVMRQRE